jgi:carboxypeptidase family protein
MGGSTRAGRQSRRLFALVATTLVAGLGACTDSPQSTGPVLPGNPSIPPQYRGAAWQFVINPQTRTVRVIPPTASTIAGSLASASISALDGNGPSLSLLGEEVVDISVVPNSFVAGPLNNPSPGKRLLSFDIVVNNKMNGADLIAPTFPAPPAGSVGPVLFPFEITTTATSGGATGGAGQIVVVPPHDGVVMVSPEWDGTPHNFFNDVGCGPTSNDCFRWEEFSVVNAGGSSNSKKIGFEIDASVGDFVVNVILAANLRNAGGPTQFGTVAGTVTSPQLGNISGATVNVSGGFSGTTAANGSYSIGNVGVGARTVSVTGLPGSCTPPASQNVTVTNGGTATANFSVQCTAPTGTVAGTISSSLGGTIAGAAVTVTPTGGSTSPVFTTAANGQYSIVVAVGAGTGTIGLSNLPANCTAPVPATPYSGLTANNTVTVNITVQCAQAPGSVTGTVTRSDDGLPIQGATVTLTPTGGSALAGVQTNASGVYTRSNVPVGGGDIQLTTLPAGCSHSGTPYSGVTSGNATTINIVATCVAAAFQYPLTGTWGAITNTGPTGRQVTLELRINMGAAPGNPNVNGTSMDEFVGIQMSLNYTNNALITYASRTFPDPNLDFGAAGSPSAGLTNVSVSSSQGLTSNGNVFFVRLTYNITAGASGSVTPTVSLTQVLAGAPPPNQIDVTANVSPITIPTLIIP